MSEFEVTYYREAHSAKVEADSPQHAVEALGVEDSVLWVTDENERIVWNKSPSDGPSVAGMPIPDEAVEAALDVLMDDGHNGIDCRPTRNFQVSVRAALEAALPLLAPKPLLDRMSVDEAIRQNVWVTICDELDGVDGAVDDVLKLARPMPTREEMELTFLRVFEAGGLWDGLEPDAYKVRHRVKWAGVFTDAVEKLLKGEES